MLIPVDVYIKFYEILREKFYEDEVQDKAKIPIGSDKMWFVEAEQIDDPLGNKQEKGKKTKKKYKIQELFKFQDPRHFYRKYSKAFSPPDILVKDIHLVPALNYILSKKNGPTKSFKAEAEDLFANFIKAYPIEQKKQTGESILKHNASVSAKEEVFSIAKQTVADFFSHISNEKFTDAWRLISPKHSINKWWGGYDVFKDEFTKKNRKVSFSNIEVFRPRRHEDLIFFKVYADIRIEFTPTASYTSLQGYLSKNLAGRKDLEINAIAASIYAGKNEELNLYKNLNIQEWDKLYPGILAFDKSNVYSIICSPFDQHWLIQSLTFDPIFNQDLNLFINYGYDRPSENQNFSDGELFNDQNDLNDIEPFID